jgi:hypothetical protein
MHEPDPTDATQRPKKGATTPGDAQNVPVPNEHAAEGTSEEFAAVQGVHTFPETAAEQDRDDLPAAGDHRDLDK